MELEFQNRATHLISFINKGKMLESPSRIDLLEDLFGVVDLSSLPTYRSLDSF